MNRHQAEAFRIRRNRGSSCERAVVQRQRPVGGGGRRSYRLRTGHSIAGIKLLSYRDDGSVEQTFGGSGAIVAAPGVNMAVDATALIFTPDHRALGLPYRFGPSGYFALSRFLL